MALPNCHHMVLLVALLLLLVSVSRGISVNSSEKEHYVSGVGDPGMARDELRLAIEAWNQCNEVGEEAPNMGSPRAADCFDLHKPQQQGQNHTADVLLHRVTEKDNRLGVGQPFAGLPRNSLHNVDLYAAQKEVYLGKKCQVDDKPKPWQFWMIMLKSGNMDTYAAKCPKNGHKVGPFGPSTQFPCFGKSCMNQPLIYHNYTALQEGPKGNVLKGRFYGSWDLDYNGDLGQGSKFSYYSVTWEKEMGKGSWVFHHVLRTSVKYPWLMLYLRADATKGFSGGYHYPTRGMLKIVKAQGYFCNHHSYVLTWLANGNHYFHGFTFQWLLNYKNILRVLQGSFCNYTNPQGQFLQFPQSLSMQLPESPDFKVRFTLNVINGGGPNSQFYLLDIGSCWKNDGSPCDGDVTSDVTRYSEMILNPGTPSWCNPGSPKLCPPYHTFPNGTRVHRNDTARFPYGAYHLYCSPGNAVHAEMPNAPCDPYSNPQPQEILQILPHPVWGDYGYPTKKGQGWIGDPRTWELDVGRLSQSLYFYQDPGTALARRQWRSIDLGTEIYKDPDQVAEWTVSDFDVLVPS